MKLAVLANGPGEVWGWSRPVIFEAASRGWTVDVHLLPCPFASGKEYDVLSSRPVKLYRHKSTYGAFRKMMEDRAYDAILQLGGDLLFGRFLAWRHSAPLACYSYGLKKGMRHCDKVLTSRPGLYDAENMEIVGDLVLDSLDRANGLPWRAPEGRRLVFFPGSRANIRRKAFALLNRISAYLKERDRHIEARVLLSPFSDGSEIQIWREAGFSVWKGSMPAGISGADLAITQPGTNTLELMYCAQPFMIVAPFSFVREVPLSGLAGMVDAIPWLGSSLREVFVLRRAQKFAGRSAWPNRLSRETVVPELVGEFTPEEIAEEILKALKDSEGLSKQRRLLRGLAEEVLPGAPSKICDILERMAAGH